MLIKKFRNVGNSWGLIIPKAVLDMANFNPVKDEVSIEVENGKLIIKKHTNTNNK
ncbi:MAG: AbrB/MazE/SpoVT family DNA-binding domain-containing protein [Cyanobacteria bacterium SIG26]|nr:AbrB/MazE/SpoVT family DNA-binding domain-containing protein [Cyanobacteria bacterium SIG26]